VGSLLLFILAILLVIVLFVFSIIRRFLRGFFSIFRGDVGGTKGRNDNSVSGENYDVVQSEEGAVRMRKFKTLAEDSEYEECVIEE